MRWYPAKGKVVYKPDSWIILEVNPSIVTYYNYWSRKLSGKVLSTSFHKPHVTLCNGNFDWKKNHPNWNKFNNQIINFEYSNLIEFERQIDGKTGNENLYFWVAVKCEKLKEIRLSLGLSEYPKWPYHLTVGHCDLGAGESEKFKKVYGKT